MKKFSLEVQVLECEVRLHNACGLDSGPQDILLSRDVGGLGYPVQIIQVAEGRTQRKGERGERKKAARRRKGGETSGTKCVRNKGQAEEKTPGAFSIINKATFFYSFAEQHVRKQVQ